MENSARNPYGYYRSGVVACISKCLDLENDYVDKILSEPPEHVGYDLAFPLMRFCRGSGECIDKFTKCFGECTSNLKLDVKHELTRGYFNVKINLVEYSKNTIKAVLELREDYGKVDVGSGETVVVEHTSANPIHPLHIGHARNASLGDTLARLLSFTGYRVVRRFYIDDVGRQTAVVAYGLSILGGPRDWEKLMRGWKPDHWIGVVYALTNLLIELKNLKREIRVASGDRYRELLSKQDSIVYAIAKLQEKARVEFEKLSEKIMSDNEDPEESIRVIMKSYEEGLEPYKTLVRKAVEYALAGFRETLSKLGVEFDKWDWESDLLWSGLVNEILEKARETPYYTMYKEAEALDLTALAEDEVVRRKLRIPGGLEVPPLILRRSDGTTLYTTRDIAYSILKFRDTGASMVINVVGKEQTLPQAQVRLALYALSYKSYAEKLVHYAYEMVNLPGRRMSGRRGEYVTLDEILDGLRRKAEEELRKRGGGGASPEDIGYGAARYFLVSVSASKPLTFKLEDVINFEKNTAPYIQYAHARASSILRKAGGFKEPVKHDWCLENKLRGKLVKLIGKFPWIVSKAARELKPELIVEYLGSIAQAFNKWYTTDNVLNDEVEDRRNYKLCMVYGVKVVLKNALWILGVKAPDRM